MLKPERLTLLSTEDITCQYKTKPDSGDLKLIGK